MTNTSRRERIFLLSLIVAFLTHCSMFFGGAMGVNEDNFSVRKISVNNAAYGRWICDVLNKMGIPGQYLAQSWIGIIVIAALAVTCTVVLSLVKVKGRGNNFLIIAFLAAFPTLAYGYGYLFDAIYYSFSLLAAALAVYYTNKKKYGWLMGAFMIMISLGLYQAWISFAAAFANIYILMQLKENELSKRQTIMLILRNAAMGLLGIIFYLISVKIYNKIFDVTLTTYKGLDSMGQIPLHLIGIRILNCYQTFGRYLTGKLYFMPKPAVICNIFVLCVCLLSCLNTFIRKLKDKKYFDGMLFLLFVAVLPIGMCLMDLAAGENDTLSVYAICLLYIFVIWLCDSIQDQRKKKFAKYISISSIAMVICFYFITQIYYYKIHVFYQRTYAIANRMVMRIEELEEYPRIRKVAIGGTLRERRDYGTSETMFDDVIISDRGLVGQYVGLNYANSDYSLSKFASFANGFLGSNFEYAKMSEMTQRLKTDRYAEMPVWPRKGSIRVIDDIIVVKLEEYYWIHVQENQGSYRFEIQSGKEKDTGVYYVWQLFLNGKEISHCMDDQGVYRTDLDQAGNYSVRVYIKDVETNEVLHRITSDTITIY